MSGSSRAFGLDLEETMMNRSSRAFGLNLEERLDVCVDLSTLLIQRAVGA